MDVMALVVPMLALLQATGDVSMIGVGIAAGTAVIGPGAGMGYLIGQTIASIHRQPEAFDQTRTLMFLGIGLVEAFFMIKKRSLFGGSSLPGWCRDLPSAILKRQATS